MPAAAQPVADRVSYGDLGDDISVDTDPDGRVYFVTVSEPAQSLLGYWVGVDEPEVEFSTYEEKYGTQTPSQQREVSLQMMYGSSQVAQYVALTRSGFDAEIIPGAVQVQQFLCLRGSGNRCDEFVPVADELEIGDTLVERRRRRHADARRARPSRWPTTRRVTRSRSPSNARTSAR